MSTSWKVIAEGFRPAVPAYDYLENEHFDKVSFDDSIKTALAAALYRFKNGASVCLTLPIVNPYYLKPILYYLHTCRIDTMHGLIRASWFNSYHMVMSPDLLVWTRASMQTRLLKHDRQLHAQHIGLNRETRQLKETIDDEGRIARTIISQSANDIVDFVSSLQPYLHPFAIVVDMTAFGYKEDPRHLAGLMEAYFPGCPMLFLSSAGDAETDKALKTLPSRYQTWQQNIFDDNLFGIKLNESNWSLRLIEVPDIRLSDLLLNAAKNIKEVVELLPKAHHSQVVSILYRVLNALQTLSIPYETYNELLITRRRGGIFPVKPLSDWLGKAGREKLPTGQSQGALENAINALEQILDLVKNGKTGKYQALNKWIKTVLSLNKRGVIIVSGQNEANFLRSWLVTDYVYAVDKRILDVVGARSIREIYKFTKRYDRALVLGKMWGEDFWAVFTAKSVDWLSYPGEMYWHERQIAQISQSLQRTDDRKSDWWLLKSISNTALPSVKRSIIREKWGDCTGEYKFTRTEKFEFLDDPNWLISLLADIRDPDEITKYDTVLSPGEVVITTELDQYRFDATDTLDVLYEKNSDTKVESVTAREVKEGQRLIVLHGEDRNELSLFESLIDFVVEDSQHEISIEIMSKRWFDYLDSSYRKYKSIKGLQKKLQEGGINYQDQTIQRWLNRSVISPRDKENIIPVLAKLSGIDYTEGDLKAVINGIKHILGLHVKIGKLIKEAMLAEIEGTTTVMVNKKSISIDELKALYGIETIISVHIIEPETPENIERSLPKILKNGITKSQGRLVFTNKALKSSEESPYNDFDKAENCLLLLSNEFYEVCVNRMSLEHAINTATQYGIEYRGDSSLQTKGQFKNIYYRHYEGKKIDIGKHLTLGDSRNPERCLRIHFHFDETNKQIVIHHFGRHLPVASG